MKTYPIKDLLKKELLIVELPRVCDYKLTKEMIFIMDKEKSTIHRIKGSYTLLGKPDEINEEDAKAIVEYFPEILGYQNFKDDDEYYKETATESLLSAIESVIFWENPLGDQPQFTTDSPLSDLEKVEQWHDAERRTFDRNRSIILKKNK